MATINYRFADGHVEAIEVTDEFAARYAVRAGGTAQGLAREMAGAARGVA